MSRTHVVAVLEDVVSKRHGVDVERESPPEPAPLRWDPVRPVTGLGEWLARVRRCPRAVLPDDDQESRICITILIEANRVASVRVTVRTIAEEDQP